jgi:hypothetical protein
MVSVDDGGAPTPTLMTHVLQQQLDPLHWEGQWDDEPSDEDSRQWQQQQLEHHIYECGSTNGNTTARTPGMSAGATPRVAGADDESPETYRLSHSAVRGGNSDAIVLAAAAAASRKKRKEAEAVIRASQSIDRSYRPQSIDRFGNAVRVHARA